MTDDETRTCPGCGDLLGGIHDDAAAPDVDGYQCARATIAALRVERDELRAALELFVTFHSGHVLPGTLAPAMIAGRNALATKETNDD